MSLPAPTAKVSLMKYGTTAHPVIGECSVGVGEGEKEKVDATAIARSSWNGSVTTSTDLTLRLVNGAATL